MDSTLTERSELQKRLIQHLEPQNLLDLEERLKEVLQTERALLKLANRLDVSPTVLQSVVDDLIDIVNLLQI